MYKLTWINSPECDLYLANKPGELIQHTSSNAQDVYTRWCKLHRFVNLRVFQYSNSAGKWVDITITLQDKTP